MNENLFMSIYLFFIFIVMLIIMMFTPKFTRKEIKFGIRVPENKVNSTEIKNIERKFIKNNLIIGIPVIVIFSILNYMFSNVVMILFTTFAFVFVTFLVYMISNKAVKKLKIEKGWFKGNKQSVIIDTSFSKEKNKNLVTPWIFLISVIIIIINIVLSYKYYNLLPDKVPTHWDFSGNITGYQIKSKMLIWEMPGAEIFTTILFFIVYKSIGWSKQQINHQNPESSVKKNRIFRRAWSKYIAIFSILINLLLTMGTLQIFRVVDMNNKMVNVFIIGFLVITLVITLGSIIFLSMKLGQGGGNIKIKGEDENCNFNSNSRDDDMYWKIANTIYYNPDDPSLFIEKRFGIGWTINAGRPLGMAIYIGIIIFTIAVIVMASFSKK